MKINRTFLGQRLKEARKKTLEISADYVLQDSLYIDYEIGDDEKKKHISYQRFGAEKTEQLLYMLDKLTAMMK